MAQSEQIDCQKAANCPMQPIISALMRKDLLAVPAALPR